MEIIARNYSAIRITFNPGIFSIAFLLQAATNQITINKSKNHYRAHSFF